jgi:hypothetical protein
MVLQIVRLGVIQAAEAEEQQQSTCHAEEPAG